MVNLFDNRLSKTDLEKTDDRHLLLIPQLEKQQSFIKSHNFKCEKIVKLFV